MASRITEENRTKGIALIKSEYLFHGQSDTSTSTEPAAKKLRVDSQNGSTDEKSGKARGQNKQRYYKNKVMIDKKQLLCNSLIDVRPGAEIPQCTRQNCRNMHDLQEYLNQKAPDIGKNCYVFNQRGHCPRGVTCLFASEHIDKDGRNIVTEEFKNDFNGKFTKTDKKDVQIMLRKRTYDFSPSEKIINSVAKDTSKEPAVLPDTDRTSFLSEKKKIDWKGKLYLAPLTTLGNLPFRRICKEYGVDITCGEMALATSILQGLPQELALLRRHPSEDLFGVQICGSNHSVLTKCTQLICDIADVDFIDLNLGCPIEMIYKKGGGSGLLLRRNELQKVIQCMTRVSKCPITVKTRSGVYENKPIAHEQVPIYDAAGVSLITVHGRSREQRYTRSADWKYIHDCARVVSTPVFGSGDILSYHDYNHVVSTYPEIAGVMIGRGALYKPWIFTEIKEQRDWDISSAERFAILQKFVNYGFEHWGSDIIGVENTRRFLLEWLSFLHRYIPVGLLEVPPQKINERPQRYLGRNDLETLMASPNCDDWVKISEMLCGPVPDGFNFLPKHKASAWAPETILNNAVESS